MKFSPWIEKNTFESILSHPIQSFRSLFCGWYATPFCLSVGNNLMTPPQFVKIFVKKTKSKKDEIVTHFIKKLKINDDIFYFHNFGYFPGKSFCFLTASALASDLDIFLDFDLVCAGDMPASTASLFVRLLDWNIFIVFGLVLVCAGVKSASADFLFVAPFD